MFTFLISLLFIACVNQVTGDCDKGWSTFQRKCYITRDVEGSFNDNSEWCKSLNATMVSVHSKAQNDFLRDLSSHWTWLGCKQRADDSVDFECEDGANVDYMGNLFNSPSNGEVNGLALYEDGDWGYSRIDKDHNQMCQKAEVVNGSPFSVQPKVSVKPIQGYNLTEINQSYGQFKQSVLKHVDDTFKEIEAKTPRSCPLGWDHFEDNCYVKSDAELSFPEAEIWCHSLNASMLRIHSEEENIFLKTLISGNTWMGGKQSTLSSNDIRWSDLSLADYSNFIEVSKCIPGCGLILETTGKWSFDYTHSPGHKKYTMCMKLTDEKQKELQMKAEINELEVKMETVFQPNEYGILAYALDASRRALSCIYSQRDLFLSSLSTLILFLPFFIPMGVLLCALSKMLLIFL